MVEEGECGHGICKSVLIPEKQNPNWKKGIPHSWVRKEWHTALLIIHRYITCEGRFSLVYLYHIRLLIHINGDYPLNLPYFYLKVYPKCLRGCNPILLQQKAVSFIRV
jgi:hypothetical protein